VSTQRHLIQLPVFQIFGSHESGTGRHPDFIVHSGHRGIRLVEDSGAVVIKNKDFAMGRTVGWKRVDFEKIN
jgi:hypothetical protein